MHKGEKKKLQNNIWKIYLFKFLTGMFFSIPVVVLFWQENGLSLTQVMLLQSVFALVIVAFEIPSGYFADRYGRRNALIIGAVNTSVAIGLYGIGHTFSHFLFAEIFFGLGASFVSGTLAALVYDTLKDLDRTDEYQKIWGKAFSISMIALAITSIIGGFIAHYDLRYTLVASVPFFILLIPVAMSLQEPSKHKRVIEEGYVEQVIQIVRESMIHNKKLRWLIVYSGVIYAFNQGALWLYQPYFSLSGLDVVYFGFVFASFQIVAAITSKYAYLIEKRLGEKYSLIMMIFLVSVSFLLMGNFIFLFSFSFAFLQQFVRGFRTIVISDYINKLTTSDVRATVLSIESFSGRLLYALLIPFVGVIADAYSVTQALTILGITSGLVGIIMIFILRKYRII